ncbi:MAG: DUF1559 domain-containing protein [Gemmatales bacterium]
MISQQRNTLAVVCFAALILITGYFDPVLAIDVGVFSLLVAILIKIVIRWSKEPKQIVVKIIGMIVGVLLLLIIGFFLYTPVLIVCSLVAVNASSSHAGTKLRTIVIAMHNWHEDHQRFPEVANRSATGEPLLSWRVHLLPYLDQEVLYHKFHLDEPWDSPHNIKLLPQMPECYRLPGYGQQAPHGGTFYQLFVGPGAVFETHTVATIPQLKAAGRLGSTIIAGIAQNAVPWTKPADLVFTEGKPLELGRVVRQSPGMLNALFRGRDVNREPGEGNRRFWLVFADGHLDCVYGRETLGKLGPYILWQGTIPKELDDLR